MGLLNLGVADHLPLLPQPDAMLTMSLRDLPGYASEIQDLQTAFPGYVLLGIEADFRPHTADDVRDLLDAYPFDYVIGSVHFLDDWGFDDPRYLDQYDDKNIDAVWIEYFQLVGDAADSGLFTILGHLDLVKKFGYRPTRTLDEELSRLVERIADSGVLVEINTAGLHRPVAEAYPSMDILRRLSEARVPITFGSDAHQPEHVGRDFPHAVEWALEAGFTTFASLEQDPDGGRAHVRTQPLGI
jgi:histidinol-phosphatase (PHP family)